MKQKQTSCENKKNANRAGAGSARTSRPAPASCLSGSACARDSVGLCVGFVITAVDRGSSFKMSSSSSCKDEMASTIMMRRVSFSFLSFFSSHFSLRPYVSPPRLGDASFEGVLHWAMPSFLTFSSRPSFLRSLSTQKGDMAWEPQALGCHEGLRYRFLFLSFFLFAWGRCRLGHFMSVAVRHCPTFCMVAFAFCCVLFWLMSWEICSREFVRAEGFLVVEKNLGLRLTTDMSNVDDFLFCDEKRKTLRTRMDN